ncbi:MAG: tRNA (guanosine(46)-N7)-methyltransferase TrmB [Methylococcaceae bacterium]|nr:tRNA (guanosine(46)-N7)-methyltransferase TrmB [Methylococcaceae bacterium]
MNETDPRRRPIRSYVLRQGRITLAQQTALDQLWPQYGLDSKAVLIPQQVFGRFAPLVAEIGFGNGESLVQMAAAAPDQDFVGIEVHRPGVGHLLIKIRELGLANVRVYCADAQEVLANCIAGGTLDRIQVYFPDPWHKKRHRKRRLVSTAFAELAAAKLKLGGILHCATDWEDYALQMLELLDDSPLFANQAGTGRYSERPEYRPLTKFENRGQQLGHGVWDLLYRRVTECASRPT